MKIYHHLLPTTFILLGIVTGINVFKDDDVRGKNPAQEVANLFLGFCVF